MMLTEIFVLLNYKRESNSQKGILKHPENKHDKNY